MNFVRLLVREWQREVEENIGFLDQLAFRIGCAHRIAILIILSACLDSWRCYALTIVFIGWCDRRTLYRHFDRSLSLDLYLPYVLLEGVADLV